MTVSRLLGFFVLVGVLALAVFGLQVPAGSTWRGGLVDMASRHELTKVLDDMRRSNQNDKRSYECFNVSQLPAGYNARGFC